MTEILWPIVVGLVVIGGLVAIGMSVSGSTQAVDTQLRQIDEHKRAWDPDYIPHPMIRYQDYCDARKALRAKYRADRRALRDQYHRDVQADHTGRKANPKQKWG